MTMQKIKKEIESLSLEELSELQKWIKEFHSMKQDEENLLLIKRVRELRGKYKGFGLMKSLIEDHKKYPQG